MTEPLRILMAQINPIVGAIAYNTDKIMQIIIKHQHTHDIIIFPELAICGYPPQDLLLRHTIHQEIDRALASICTVTQHCHIVIGHPQMVNGICYNTASILYQKTCIAQYYKQQLPNYGVFDEQRYFRAGPSVPCIVTIKEQRIGICICEDLWHRDTINLWLTAGIDMLVSINASPFDYTKSAQRLSLLKNYAHQGIIMMYVNLVGGQDELVFDGQSMVVDAGGTIVAQAPTFQEALSSIAITNHRVAGDISPVPHKIGLIYQALVLGLQEYVRKNKIPGVLLGLSGGIDSALCLAIAVDALGAERVTAVILPSRYTAAHSTIDALAQIKTLNVAAVDMSIEPSFQALLSTLAPILPGAAEGITGENLQARIRGILLMALSNHSGNLLLCTTNKSEAAVGYGTLYGDMCGGYAVIKDVFKTMVYDLVRYRNQNSRIIPERVLTRAPSAELAPNQTDQDSLPAYDVLDAILAGYMEQCLSFDELRSLGHPEQAISQILHLIKRSEYKRHQAPPGTKISPCAFGRDWRYPITQQCDAIL